MQYSKSPEKLNFKSEGKYLVSLSTDRFEDVFPKRSFELISKGLTSMISASFKLKSLQTYNPMTEIPKNILIFLTASLSKVMAVSIICVFIKSGALGIFVIGNILVLAACLEITRRCYKVGARQWGESLVMSWLTITNLGRGKDAAVCRLVSTLYWNIAHTITFTVILVICNTDPGIDRVDLHGFEAINWSGVPLAHDLFTQNILLICTIFLGWLSIMPDIITAAVKNCCRSRDNNTKDQWDNAILLEGLKY